MANGGLINDYLVKAAGAPSAYAFPGGSTGVPSLGVNSTETLMYINTTNNHAYMWDGAAFQDVTGAGGGGLTNSSIILGSDVSLAASNTWYDALTLTLGIGTWLVNAHAQFHATTNAAFVAKLYDGATTIYASGAVVSNFSSRVSMTALVVLAASTTVKLAGNTNGTTAQIQAATSDETTGNFATQLVAVKVV